MIHKTTAVLIAAMMPICSLGATSSGSGLVGDPYILANGDSKLDSGYYTAASDVTLADHSFIGFTAANNFLTVDSGWKVQALSLRLGYASGSSGTLTVSGEGSTVIGTSELIVGLEGRAAVFIKDGGTVTDGIATISAVNGCTGGAVTVSGKDAKGNPSTWTTTGEFRIADYMNATLTIENGGVVSNGNCYVSSNTTATSTIIVRGEGSLWDCTSWVYLGNYGAADLRIEDGAGMNCATLALGMNGDSASATVSITGKGSYLDGWATFAFGNLTMTVADDALVSCYGLQPSTSAGVVRLAGGTIALKSGSLLSDAQLGTKHLQCFDGRNYVAVTADNIAALKAAKLLTVTYYDASNFVAGDTLYDTYSGKDIDLSIGYTVLRGGVVPMDWTEITASGNGWLHSSWLGWFYTDTTFGNWIYSATHGWLYIYSMGDGQIAAWDAALGLWWFTSEQWYPTFYDYSSGSWFYYMNGAAPNRNFWSYAKEKVVSESK